MGLLEPQPEQAERQPEKQQEKPFLLEQLLEHQPEQASGSRRSNTKNLFFLSSCLSISLNRSLSSTLPSLGHHQV